MMTACQLGPYLLHEPRAARGACISRQTSHTQPLAAALGRQNQGMEVEDDADPEAAGAGRTAALMPEALLQRTQFRLHIPGPRVERLRIEPLQLP